MKIQHALSAAWASTSKGFKIGLGVVAFALALNAVNVLTPAPDAAAQATHAAQPVVVDSWASKVENGYFITGYGAYPLEHKQRTMFMFFKFCDRYTEDKAEAGDRMAARCDTIIHEYRTEVMVATKEYAAKHGMPKGCKIAPPDVVDDHRLLYEVLEPFKASASFNKISANEFIPRILASTSGCEVIPDLEIPG